MQAKVWYRRNDAPRDSSWTEYFCTRDIVTIKDYWKELRRLDCQYNTYRFVLAKSGRPGR